MLVSYPLCLDCKHFDFKNKKNGRPVCKAYPDGIPKDVIAEKSEPNINVNTPCNNGYKFEKEKANG